MAQPDLAFTKALPKAELHAHFSGSISKQCLHDIWTRRRAQGELTDLDNPLAAIKAGEHDFVDVATFFPLFDKYIYSLVDKLPWVTFAFEQVLRDFAEDGVRYLELRTTPRSVDDGGKDAYVRVLNEYLGQRERERPEEAKKMVVYLILSVDRKMTAEQAMAVIDQAIRYRYRPHDPEARNCYVVGVDLCGNPARGDVFAFTSAFKKAKDHGLKITAHFAEIAESSTDEELETILSWQPDRLGHCVHVPEKLKQTMRERQIALELCLSCNVLAGLTTGGFDKHHFRDWYEHGTNTVALCTDDVGVFGSSLSNEYLLASQHFGLGRRQLLELSQRVVGAAFVEADAMRLLCMSKDFDADHGSYTM